MSKDFYEMVRAVSGLVCTVVAGISWILAVLVVAAQIKGLPGLLLTVAMCLAPPAGAFVWSHVNLDRIRKLEAVKDKFRN